VGRGRPDAREGDATSTYSLAKRLLVLGGQRDRSARRTALFIRGKGVWGKGRVDHFGEIAFASGLFPRDLRDDVDLASRRMGCNQAS
jgi:hypothetical protein